MGTCHIRKDKMVTREWLLEQTKKYKAQRDSAIATANANVGALEAIELALSELDKKEEEENIKVPIKTRQNSVVGRDVAAG